MTWRTVITDGACSGFIGEMAGCPEVFSPLDEGRVTIISKSYMNNGHCGSVRASRIGGTCPLIYVILYKNTGFAILTHPPQPSCLFLGKIANLRKATVRFVMSVRPRGTARLPLDGFS
jgi:hypothetical protein